MNKLLLAAALALAPAAAPAQAPASPAPPAAPAPLADADPAMWVVRDDDTIIYLFGTIHLLDDRPWFNDEVRTAFDASDEVVLEAILPDNPAEIMPL
ncbi:MAG: TraB/GumN family protein, partial [Allosphingosinicella sp.]